MRSDLKPLFNQLRQLIKKYPTLCKYELEKYAEPSIRFKTQRVKLNQLALGESRFGGIPDVPPNFKWPRWMPTEELFNEFYENYYEYYRISKSKKEIGPKPLGFIAQIDLSTIPKINAALPSSGWLYFFYDRVCMPWGSRLDERGSFRVVYSNCNRASLQRMNPPLDANKDHIAKPCRLKTRIELTLDNPLNNSKVYHNESKLVQSQVSNLYQDLLWPELPQNSRIDLDRLHRLLGHALPIQDCVEMDCYNVFSKRKKTISIEEEFKRYEKAASEWCSLLQIDSDKNGPGWLWEISGGRIYYCIKRKDLKALQFDNAWLILQCT